MLCVAVTAGDSASATLTVNALLPVAVAVPEITPPAFKTSPIGREPEEMLHVYGATPPVAVNVVEYATVVTAVGTLVVEIETVPALTTSVNCWLALPWANIAIGIASPIKHPNAKFNSSFFMSSAPFVDFSPPRLARLVMSLQLGP